MSSKQIAGLMEKVNILKDEQEKVQKKTFTKWINSYLCQLDPPKLVKDLMTDFKDGLLLLDLLGLLTKTTLRKEQPKNIQRIHCLTNVKTALEFMVKEKKIKMVNINPSDVVDGKPAIVLGLVWTSILHFQIEEQEEFLLQALGMENDPNAKLKGQARKGLMAWANNALSEKYGLNIKDFGECWRDGKAFNALVHNIDPSLIDMEEMEKQTVRERLENAFNVAESELGIPRLLDVEDVDVENPDEKSIMTYVGQFLKSFPEGRRPDDERKVKPPPPTDLDVVKAFNTKVENNFEDPKLKDNYEIFADLMGQKDGIQTKLDNLTNGSDPNIDARQLDRAKDEFERNNNKLNEWQWNFDKKLPGKMGSEIGPWLQSAEKYLMEPFPEIDDKNFSKNIADRLKEHEKIFNEKNNILKKFNELKRNMSSNVPMKQLENLQKRLENVMENEEKIREQLNLFALQDLLKEKSKKWNKDLDSWNAPVNSQNDLNERMKQFQASTNNGDSMEKYNNDLSDLIKRKAKFCKENPDFDPKLLDFLNQSIVECEEENDVLPEKFEASRVKLEHLTGSWNEIADSEKIIETFLNKLKKAMQSDDLDAQKELADKLPEIADFLESMREKVREELAPYSSPEVIKAFEKKMENFDKDLQLTGEKAVNQIEMQEQEIARQQQEAQELMINNLVSNSEADLKDVSDWINELEGCIGPKINGSSKELQNTLKVLENLNKSAPEIQKLLNQGYETVEELRRANEPEKANKIKKTLDDLQKVFTNYKEKEIPKSLNNLKTIIDTIKTTEKGIDDLDKFMEEGDVIKKFLEDPKNSDDSSDILNKEKKFLAKGRDITDSIKREKDLLKKLKEMSRDGNLNIDLSPLEKKIASSEKALQEILQKAEDNVTATNKCDEACKTANQYIDNLGNKIRKDSIFANDEDGQKAKMKSIENMTKDLENAEELIKEALNQRNSAATHLTKPEIAKIDKKIAQMKENAAEMKNNLTKSKKELATNLDDWGKYKKSKENVVNDFENTIKDLEKCHKDNNGIHGRDSNDKAAILKDNKKRLDDMKKQEKEIDNLLEMAKRLGSEKPLAEVQNLKKKHQKQREDLEKEIQQNAKELENHKQLDNDMNEFKNWLKETEKLTKKIDSLPDTKEGLIEKQRCLAELENLKSPGEKKLKDLKNLMKTVLNETNPNEKNKINSDIESEIDRYNRIFVNLDQQDGINDTIKILDSIGERSHSLLENIDDINLKLEKCFDLPIDSVNEKSNLGKDLKGLKNQLDQQKAQIKDLKKQCGSLEKSGAADELKSKLDQMEKVCSKMEKEVNDKIQENEKELEQQIEMEKKLNEFADLINETEDEINNSLPPGTSEAAIEESLRKLQKIKSKYAPGKKLLENIIKSGQGFNAPKKCVDDCKNSEGKYFDLADEIANLETKLASQKDNWSKFNSKKADIDKGMNSIADQINHSHDIHKGIHGGDCADKTSLLESNKKRLADLNKEEAELDKLLDMAENLNSDKPLAEVQNLKKKFQKQRQELEKEIDQNEKDLENHKQLENEIDSFHDWLKETERLVSKIESLPDSKEGLMEKQSLLEELNNLKSNGNEKLKDLKRLQKVVLNETAPDHRNEINSNVDDTLDQFKKLFGNLDRDQDSVKETIEKIDKIEEKSDQVLKDIDEIGSKLKKSSKLPIDSINDKEKFGKELKTLDRTLEQEIQQIRDLKTQCASLGKTAATDEILSKLEEMEDQCQNLKASIQEQISTNDNDIKNQTVLEKKLNEFDTLTNKMLNEIDDCTNAENNEAVIENNLKKLKKIKLQHAQGNDMLNDIMQSTSQFNVPHQLGEACEKSQQRFSNIDDEIEKLENKLENQKKDWNSYNTKKDELDKWLDDLSGNMEKLIRKNGGTHAGKLVEKEQLLDNHTKLLQDVLNHETDFKILVDKSTPLLTGLSSDSPKRATEALCKKYEKIVESLRNTVQQNEEDLEKHKTYKDELDSFIDENKSIIKDIHDELAELPNTKEGLIRKLEIFDNLKQIYNQRKKLLVNLESNKNDVMDHSSSNCYQDLEHQWDQVVDLFEKSFNPPSENQAKLLETVQQIEKTELACDDLQSKLADLEERQNAIMNQPMSSVVDIESKLKSIKAIRSELKELLTPFNEISRRQSQIPNEVESVKQKVEQLLGQYKSLCESSNSNINECEDQHRQLSNICAGINNFKAWLNHTSDQIEDQGKVTTLELSNLKKGLNSLKIIRDDIAEHKVDLSRLQTAIDSFMKISNDISLQNSFDELAETYGKLHESCQNEADKNDLLIRLMNKYENSRSNVLHWIETNTQILLKCSDYTLNPSQIKSKLMMIENLEKDLENSGQMKFVEAIQDGEELMNELSGTPLQMVAQQNTDLKTDWLEISRQLNQLSSNLKNATARYEAFKDISNRLSSWLDDMEHTGLMDSSSIEHRCEIPTDENSKSKADRIKTLLVEVDRHKQDFNQLSNMAAELANPSFTMENSQIQNRFNRLQANLKDKIDKINKQQADYDKIKQNIEDMEKWIFQTSIKIINENAEQGNNSGNQDIDELIENSNDIIKSILAKEPEMSKIHQSFESILKHSDNQTVDKQKELQEDLRKLNENYNNLKDTAIHKRDHLVDNVKQWENYQKLLQSTKGFLDNDMARWWKDRSQPKSGSLLSGKDSDFQFQEIVDMESKLNGLKKALENAAKECDGILPTITSALQRSQNPMFKTNRSSSFTATNMWTKGDTDSLKSIPSLLSNTVYEDLENNLKKLSSLKKDHEDRTMDWNNFNREKNSFKNWLDNELMKLSSALQAAPADTNMDLFHRNKLKEIQDEINFKKPVLENLNSRFNELNSKTPGSIDSILKEITREFEKAEKQVNKILNREDKQVEANFSDDDQEMMREVKVPKLNLGILKNGYESPDNLSRFSQTSKDETDNKRSKGINFCSQTLGTKMTQTRFKELTNYGTQTPRRPKEKNVSKILDSLKGINERFQRSECSPKSTLSAVPRSPNQESIRRNLISSHPHLHPSRFQNGLKTPRSLSSRPFSQSSNRPLSMYPTSPLSSSMKDNLEMYVPTKDKWLNLDTNDSPYNTSFDIHPSRQFEIDYSSTLDSRPRRNKTDIGNRSTTSKTARIKEGLNKISQDANELRYLSEKLKHY